MIARELSAEENKIFFKRWLSSPKQLGTFAPISGSLAQKAARVIFESYDPNFPIVEIGAGTGRLTRAIVKQGVHPRNVCAVELDPDLSRFLRDTMPMVKVICGDVRELGHYVKDLYGQLPSIVSVLPLMYFSTDVRWELVQVMLNAVRNDGSLYHVTYSPIDPLKAIKKDLPCALESSRIVSHWLNFPPGFVWRYTKKKL